MHIRQKGLSIISFTGAIFCAASGVFAAAWGGIEYGVAQWPESGRGNHRAIVQANKPADAVIAHIPWRRHDSSPEKKAVVIYDSATGERIMNVAVAKQDRYSGDIIFQPKTVPGTYEIYYMPYEVKGWTPGSDTAYMKPENTADGDWLLKATVAKDSLQKADVIRFEARSEFHRFDPMEIVATPDEVEKMLSANSEKSYLIFPEDRKYQVRMREFIPQKWAESGPSDTFSGQTQPGEYYVFQVGVFASGAPIKAKDVKFSALKSADGKSISASAFQCLNLDCVDWIGDSYAGKFSVAKGEVGTLLIGVMIPDNASGKYSSSVKINFDGQKSAIVKLSLDVSGGILKDHGDSELWRLSRLRWLNSRIADDETLIPPYTPLVVKKDSVGIIGRKITFDGIGLPKSIVSNGREILSDPIILSVKTESGDVKWKSEKTKIVKSTAATLIREASGNGSGLNISTCSKTEFDGCITYTMRLKANKDINLKETSLLMPIKRDVAKYMMGFGRRGGYRPESWNWKWNINMLDQFLWLGDYNAGVQIKLGDPLILNLSDLQRAGLPKSWANGGKGGATVSEAGDSVLLKVFSGDRKMKAGESLDFDFRLMVTPFKPIDKNHWNWRYGNFEYGGNILHVHHATGENPNINYPFTKTKEFTNLVQRIKNTPKPNSDGRIEYYATNCINLKKGSLHIWSTVDFDPSNSFNQGLFYLDFPNSDQLGFYWNQDVKGMRAYVREGVDKYPMMIDAPQPNWKKGEKHLLTFSWGDKSEIFIDGKLIACDPNYKGINNDSLNETKIKLGGGFDAKAIKIEDEPYTADSNVSMNADEHTLLLDTFNKIDNKVSKPQKGDTGKLCGAVNCSSGDGVSFSHEKGNFGVNLYYTIRELSNYCQEIWSLRNLGDILEGNETMIYTDKGAVMSHGGGGHAWLQEHFVDEYVPAWQATLSETDVDAAVGMKFISRWNNYYVQGMDWLMKNTGVDGLYLDGIGYDRETMKRMARVMYKNNPNYRINFHSGNSFDYLDLRQSPMNLFMEHLPYMSNLWFGEMFNYDRSADYWFVEISGIPFGLTGEMLEYVSGGNPYRAMVYGMTGRQHASCAAMWKAWDDFGIQNAQMLGYWDPKCPVTTDNPNVLATVYKKNGKSMIALGDWTESIAEGSETNKGRAKAVTGFVSKAPVIDGVISPNEWDNAARLTGFVLSGKKDLAQQQTECRVTADSERLYIAFKCNYLGDKIKANCTGREGALWEDDSVEIFIQPDTQVKKYYQFIGNANDAYYDGVNTSGDWNGDWTYKTSKENGYWQGELSIPLGSINLKSDLDGQTIGLNICRDQYSGNVENSSWSKVTGNYHDTDRFGRIEFSSTKAPSLQEVNAVQKEQSAVEMVRLKIDWKALGLDPKKVKLRAPAISGFQDAAEFSTTDPIPVELSKGWILIAQ